MAREEVDREDLLREAIALVERVELEVAGFAEPIVAGFRRDGAASFYFGANVVYQFNSRRELRRGFLDGRLYKADHGRLAALVRRRTATSVDLVRHDLTAGETTRFLGDAADRLAHLYQSLRDDAFRTIGQVPPDRDVVGRVNACLKALPPEISIAGSSRL